SLAQVRVGDGMGVGVAQGPAVGLVDQAIDAFVLNGLRASHVALDEGAGRLAGSKPGDPQATAEVAIGLVDSILDLLGRNFNSQEHSTLGNSFRGDLHAVLQRSALNRKRARYRMIIAQQIWGERGMSEYRVRPGRNADQEGVRSAYWPGEPDGCLD